MTANNAKRKAASYCAHAARLTAAFGGRPAVSAGAVGVEALVQGGTPRQAREGLPSRCCRAGVFTRPAVVDVDPDAVHNHAPRHA